MIIDHELPFFHFHYQHTLNTRYVLDIYISSDFELKRSKQRKDILFFIEFIHLRGGEGFVRRSKKRRRLPKIGHKKYRFFFDRLTDRQTDRQCV